MRPGGRVASLFIFPGLVCFSQRVFGSLCVKTAVGVKVSLSLTIEDLHSFKRCLTAPTDAVTNGFVVS